MLTPVADGFYPTDTLYMPEDIYKKQNARLATNRCLEVLSAVDSGRTRINTIHQDIKCYNDGVVRPALFIDIKGSLKHTDRIIERVIEQGIPVAIRGGRGKKYKHEPSIQKSWFALEDFQQFWNMNYDNSLHTVYLEGFDVDRNAEWKVRFGNHKGFRKVLEDAIFAQNKILVYRTNTPYCMHRSED